MYTPPAFREEDTDLIFDFIESNNFGVLFSQHQGEPEATHLPFLLNRESQTLIAHFARANKHWKKIRENEPVLVVFQGPHAYISPHWYEEKQTVPTWNYAAVHVRAEAQIIHKAEKLREMVDALTHHHEAMADSDWDYQAAHEKRDQLLGAIAGIELQITGIQAAFKLNQNRSMADQKGVIQNLSSSGAMMDKKVAQMMQDKLKIKKKPGAE